MPGLNGKVVMDTGAGDGMGAAIAHEIAGGSATVALVRRTPANLERTAANGSGGSQLRPFPGDVADPAGIHAVIEHIVAGCGRLDALVNCAALVIADTPKPAPADTLAAMARCHLKGR